MTLQISYITGSLAERLATMNAIRGVPTAQKYYDLKKTETEEISFDLMEIDHVLFGQPFSITVHIQVSAVRFWFSANQQYPIYFYPIISIAVMKHKLSLD